MLKYVRLYVRMRVQWFVERHTYVRTRVQWFVELWDLMSYLKKLHLVIGMVLCSTG